jgi:hypothetical protein
MTVASGSSGPRAAAMSASARPIRSRRRSSRPIIWSRRSIAASSSPA